MRFFCSGNRFPPLLTFVAKRTQMAALTLIPPAYLGFVGGSTSFRRIETEKSRRRNHSPVCAYVCGMKIPFYRRSLIIHTILLPASLHSTFSGRLKIYSTAIKLYNLLFIKIKLCLRNAFLRRSLRGNS